MTSQIRIGGPAQSLIGGGDRLYAISPNGGAIYRYENTPDQWTQIGGPAFSFAAGHGWLGRINADQSGVCLYDGTSGSWTQIGGPAQALIGGGDSLYAISPYGGDIYRYDRLSCQWTRLGGPGFSFAAGRGWLARINADQSGVCLYDWTSGSWTQIGGPAQALIGGGDRLYAVSPSGGDVYSYTPGKWTKLGGPGSMFVAIPGTLARLSSDGSSVDRYDSTTEQWMPVGGPAESLALVGRHLYGIGPGHTEVDDYGTPADTGLLSRAPFANRNASTRFDIRNLTGGGAPSCASAPWLVSLAPFGAPQYPDVDVSAASQGILADITAPDSTGQTCYYRGPSEWGYAFHWLSPTGNWTIGGGALPNGFSRTPTSASDAYQQVREWFRRRVAEKYAGAWIMALNGHYYYMHYGSSWLLDLPGPVQLVGAEICENISGTNAHIAFTRGAGRQFGIPWVLDVSPWFAGFTRDYTDYWYRIGDTVSASQIAGNRLALLSAGTLSVKEGPLNASAVPLASSIARFQLEGDRVAALTDGGTLLLKVGPLDTPFVQLATAVSGFQLAGNRIAMLSAGTLFVKEGLPDAPFVRQADAVDGFQLAGSRIAMLSAGILSVKEGPLDAPFVRQVDAVAKSKFQIAGTRIAALTNAGTLFVKDGPLDAPFVRLADSVDRFQLTDSRIAALTNAGTLFVKDGPLDAPFVGLADGVTDFDLSGNRIAAKVADRLLVQEGALTSEWVHAFTDPSSFSLKDGRMLVQWPDGQCFAKAQGITQPEGMVKSVNDGGMPVGGHSLSLLRRHYFASFMAGANLLDVEGGSVACFFGPHKLNGVYSLSPLGFTVRELYRFTRSTHFARPRPWAPIGLVLNREHGLGLESLRPDNKAVFCVVPASDGDLMNISLLQTIWPGSLPFPTPPNETGIMVNTPFGDLFDVLIADADSLILDYPVLYLSGAIAADDALASKLLAYVNAGGNLVLNSQHLGLTVIASLAGVQIGGTDLQLHPRQLVWSATGEALPVSPSPLAYRTMTASTAKPLLTALDVDGSQVLLATINTVGAGRVIVTGPAYLSRPDVVGPLLGHLAASVAVTPFVVTGAIQYLVNYGPGDDWALTLINNAGVTKQPTENEQRDPTKAVIVNVTYQQPGRSLAQVTNVASGAALPVVPGAWTFQVTVPAGDLVVLAVQTQPLAGAAT